jgi:hypothetical protein
MQGEVAPRTGGGMSDAPEDAIEMTALAAGYP